MTADSRSVWRPARVVENRPVSDGSVWLSLEAVDSLPASFDPGHVLGLGVMLADGQLMRHAYTVSRGVPGRRRFEHLYRVISGGRLSPRLATLSSEDEVFFHGPFHTPIHREVDPAAARIVLISTGAGIGPLFGYAEKALTEGEVRPMLLVAGFRHESDACLTDELDALRSRFQNFDWRFTLTRPTREWTGMTGRVTHAVPESLEGRDLGVAHFHLVGNGEMVELLRGALHRAGALRHRVSTETYFNHNVDPDAEEIERLAARFMKPCH